KLFSHNLRSYQVRFSTERVARADAVGFQPFARRCEVKVVKNISSELNHDFPASISSDMYLRGFNPLSRTVVNWTRSFEKRRSKLQSSATRHFFSNRGSLLR